MALRKIRLEEDEILRKKSKTVKAIDENIHMLLDDMTETMMAANGIGIAAVQIGVLKRIVLVDVGGGEEGERNIKELINPEIIETGGEQEVREGCLSLPGRSGIVERPSYIKLKALNRDGEEVIYEESDGKAVPFFHELDHLDGILYIDKLVADLDEEEDDDFDEDLYENYEDYEDDID